MENVSVLARVCNGFACACVGGPRERLVRACLGCLGFYLVGANSFTPRTRGASEEHRSRALADAAPRDHAGERVGTARLFPAKTACPQLLPGQRSMFFKLVLLQHQLSVSGGKSMDLIVGHVSTRAICAAGLGIISIHQRAPHALTCTRARRSGASRGVPAHSRRGRARRLAMDIGSRVSERDPALFGLK